MIDTAELRRLMEAANVRPHWHRLNDGRLADCDGLIVHSPVGNPNAKGVREEADLIAAAVNALPKLLDAAEGAAAMRCENVAAIIEACPVRAMVVESGAMDVRHDDEQGCHVCSLFVAAVSGEVR